MRKKQILIVILVFFLVNIASMSIALSARGATNQSPRTLNGSEAIDATPEMIGEKEVAIRKKAAEVGSAIATQASPSGESVGIGDEYKFIVSDYGLEIDYEETFVAIMEGEHGIILIAKEGIDNYDPVTDEYVFANPSGLYRLEDRISTTQFTYLLDQFDNVIYPTVGNVFGEPLPRGDEGQKVWILVLNIRDETYYGVDTSYIVGYFSASESTEYNKNIMHIDTYNWQNDAGPGSTYTIEGAFCHEYEHLVHFDVDPDEPSWVDEGCADMAAFLCGYGHFESHLAYYIAFHEWTPLTFWGNGLPDYGASYLFVLYLYEKFGGAEFISALVAEQSNGIEGIEKTLRAFGYTETFDEIFDAWTIANYLDDTKKGRGKYGYCSLDMGGPETWGWTIPYALSIFYGFPYAPFMAPFPISSEWWFLVPQPYTAHYYSFTNEVEVDVWIDGDDFAGTTAYSGTYEWYSDVDTWAWRSFYQSFEIPAGGATLNFYTFFEIEGDWDYGYVEVYDYNTEEWYTLSAPGTVDYIAHPQNNPNCPDGREPTDYEAAGRWNAFTDYSGGWIPVTMDLTPFSGHTIDLYFTTWQDGAFTLQMMYIDDISIPEIDFFDDVEAGSGSWESTGWYITDGIKENNWAVMVIDTKWVNTPVWNNAQTLHSIKRMSIDIGTCEGTLHVGETPADSGRVKVAIVSNHADHILFSNYWIYIG
ncbi:MAG: hypothetical protein ACFE91_00100 [Promethearchaeota archaeon]